MKSLMTVEQVSALIRSGERLILAGSETSLRQLPQGSWIAGTMPYFMTDRGGLKSTELIQVVQMPAEVVNVRIKYYTDQEIHNIPANYPNNGFSFVIIPAFSRTHTRYAQEASTWKGIFDRPLVGWVSGIDPNSNEPQTPMVFNGKNQMASFTDAVVMEVDLAPEYYAVPNIVNLFKQGTGDVISFPTSGFDVSTCLVNGKEQNFFDYVESQNLDQRLPLVADYMGAKVNVSFKAVDASRKLVSFYAPVSAGVEYRQALPLADYEASFKAELIEGQVKPLFTCNCILNYMYANLEGKSTGPFTGPMTFGEIAYMILSQTMVYLTVQKKAARKSA